VRGAGEIDCRDAITLPFWHEYGSPAQMPPAWALEHFAGKWNHLP